MQSRPLNCLLLITILSLSAHAVSADKDKDLVKVQAFADVSAIKPGDTFHIGLLQTIKPHWHTYWINAGEVGTPTSIHVTPPKGCVVGAIQWPVPTKLPMPGLRTYGYEKQVMLMVPVTTPKTLNGDTIELAIHSEWQVCDEEACVEGEGRYKVQIRVADKTSPANLNLFNHWRGRLPVSSNSQTGRKHIGRMMQPVFKTGSPQPMLNINWIRPPKDVEFFPVETDAVAIEDIVIKHAGKRTMIRYVPTVYNRKKLPDGLVKGVYVYTDAEGNRHGVSCSFRVPLE
jgi:thiol:disulfide interchange protein DsbD